MSLREIRLWPDPVLRQVCAPVGEDVSALIADMFDTMYDAPGRGLAAPQVGVPLRVFVMDTTWKEGPRSPIACINPVVVSAAAAQAGGEEACLSIPGVSAEVLRPSEITLRFTDETGAVQDRLMTGAEAKCAQHELDHLDVKVIFDRLEPEVSAALRKRYEEVSPA